MSQAPREELAPLLQDDVRILPQQSDQPSNGSTRLRRSTDRIVLEKSQLEWKASRTQINSAAVAKEIWAGWSYQHREYESDIPLDVIPDQRRFIDQPEFAQNSALWVLLLQYRAKKYGDDGIVAVFQAMKHRSILPTTGIYSGRFWKILLDAGLRNLDFLHEVCDYADVFSTNDQTKPRWTNLYNYIILALCQGDSQQQIELWHRRLVVGGHAPHPSQFKKLMELLIISNADEEAVRVLYLLNPHRRLYKTIMRRLSTARDLPRALSWHRFLYEHGDLPTIYVGGYCFDSLLQHMEHRRVGFHKSFRRAWAVLRACSQTGTPVRIRTIMSLAQGDAFGIREKKYDEDFGARWLATRWVSLDFAITTLSSLGVQKIGPISLQAIGLREPDCASIGRRIKQLRSSGITLGASVYSRAIRHFVETEDQDSLTATLQSDQHPTSYEDRYLQQNLMRSYAARGNWSRYNQVLAVQLAVAQDPRALRNDVFLRSRAALGRWRAVMSYLEAMHQRGDEAEQKTLEFVLRCLLPRRSYGKQIMLTQSSRRHLLLSVRILIEVLKFNGRVSVFEWQSILHRLGMYGQLGSLAQLSLWLAAWYGPSSGAILFNQSNSQSLTSLLGISRRLPKPNPSFNLNALFPPNLQSAIIKWGFIHSKPLQGVSAGLLSSIHTSEIRQSTDAGGEDQVGKEATETRLQIFQYLRGLKLLTDLRDDYDVDVKATIVREAFQNRCRILFGPSLPMKPRNKTFRSRNIVALNELRVEANRIWGGKLWRRRDLQLRVLKRPSLAWNKRYGMQVRRRSALRQRHYK